MLVSARAGLRLRAGCVLADRIVQAPGWRNWQTQRTQNPPALAVMGVRPPLPAPTKQRS